MANMLFILGSLFNDIIFGVSVIARDQVIYVKASEEPSSSTLQTSFIFAYVIYSCMHFKGYRLLYGVKTVDNFQMLGKVEIQQTISKFLLAWVL